MQAANATPEEVGCGGAVAPDSSCGIVVCRFAPIQSYASSRRRKLAGTDSAAKLETSEETSQVR
jgi:hypothetical protein